jgi:hypothetical protein
MRDGLIGMEHEEFAFAEAAVIPTCKQAQVFPRGAIRERLIRRRERFEQLAELLVEWHGRGDVFIES